MSAKVAQPASGVPYDVPEPSSWLANFEWACRQMNIKPDSADGKIMREKIKAIFSPLALYAQPTPQPTP